MIASIRPTLLTVASNVGFFHRKIDPMLKHAPQLSRQSKRLGCVCGVTQCLAWVAISIGWLFWTGPLAGQDKFERAPVFYSKTKPTDEVQQLADLLESDPDALNWTDTHGYLPAVLKRLEIPVWSQALVFSKTSLQVSRITPQTPRAIYFNDNNYVGWVQGGSMIEISAADPKLGATFYSISQKPENGPVLRREKARCLQCHASSHTHGRPGHIVRSVFPTDSGLPDYSLGTNLVSHETEFADRFGGWFVTGTHGNLRHRGNAWFPPSKDAVGTPKKHDPAELDIETRANIRSLDLLINVKPYLSPHSDLVAQLVLQHQVFMHNVLTEASFAGQQAAHDTLKMNQAFDRDPGYESDSIKNRYDSAAKKVVRALLFCDELTLTNPIAGSGSFTEEFQKLGPFDSKHRSLRELDLQTRMFRYPCSFLVYSDSFQQLPKGVFSRVKVRLNDVLSQAESSEEFLHLSNQDRAAIKEILIETGVLKSEE
jgi:hypothetical protein